MTRLRMLASRIRALFSMRAIDREFEQELESHEQLLTEENLRRGMSPDEARRAARLRLGNPASLREANHDQRGLPFVESTLRDVAYAIRMLRNSPGFALIAILTLALGIGANAAIFRVADAALFRPLPFPHPGKLVELQNAYADPRAWKSDTADPTHWWVAAPAIASVADYTTGYADLEQSGTPGQVLATLTTAQFFRVLGIPPLLGRTYTAREADSHAAVAVVGYQFWWQHLGGSPAALGRTIHLNGHQFRVIGVMPRGFSFPEEAQVWIPYRADSVGFFTASAIVLQTVARLRPSASLAQAQADLNVVYHRIQKAYPDMFPSPKNLPQISPGFHFRFGVTVVPLRQALYGRSRLPLLFLLLSAAMVWLVACANLAGLMLARTSARQEELVIRAALGATPWRLMRLLWLESVGLAVAGGAAGVALAVVALRVLLPWAPSSIAPAVATGDWPRMLAFVFLLTFVSTLLFGLAPAAAASWPSLRALTERGQGSRTVTPGSRRARQVLLGAETALTLALLVAAGLLIKSFWRLSSQPEGFDANHVLTALVPLPSTWSVKKQALFYSAVIERVAALPGVEGAALGSCLPARHMALGLLSLLPADHPGASRPVGAVGCTVSPQYFQVLRIPVVAGRVFTTADIGKGQTAAILNAAAARKLWPGKLALGQRFGLAGQGPKIEFRHEVVGVVADTRSWGFAYPVFPVFYIPYQKGTFGRTFLLARTSVPPASLASAFRSAVWSVDKTVPVVGVETLRQRMARTISAEHFRTWLCAGFAALALILACVGIFGVVSYEVSRRTREIGIRMALGARAEQVTGMMLFRGILAVWIGAAVGLGGAFALSRWLASLLFHLQPTDPEVFVGAVALVLVIATTAVWLPARRASRIDPVRALRHE